MRNMGTIAESNANSALIMDNDIGNLELAGGICTACFESRQPEGVMPLVYVLLGAIAFPLVLGAALAGGLGLLTAGLVALTLSGPLAFVVYFALALAVSRAS